MHMLLKVLRQGLALSTTCQIQGGARVLQGRPLGAPLRSAATRLDLSSRKWYMVFKTRPLIVPMFPLLLVERQSPVWLRPDFGVRMLATSAGYSGYGMGRPCGRLFWSVESCMGTCGPCELQSDVLTCIGEGSAGMRGR